MAKIIEKGLVKAGSKVLQSGFTTRFIKKYDTKEEINEDDQKLKGNEQKESKSDADEKKSD